MKIFFIVSALVWLLALSVTSAQITPFTASWTFEGTDDGTSSSGLVTASSVTYSDVNKIFNRFFSGYAGLGTSIQHWSATGCNNREYVEFSVRPQGTAQITLTSLAFAFSRSAEGPQQLMVRSSADGFGNDLFSAGTTENYQIASVSLDGPDFINQASAITFRIYACNAVQSNGTLRLDEIRINAAVLPVTLLSFTAKPEGDRVQLAWSTVSESNADRFRVERSYDLKEFIPVGEVAAAGTTNERQYYGITDLNPRPGPNYYRLKQIDVDGIVHTYDVTSTIIQINEPVVSVYPNPASPGRIHVRLWNADEASMRLLSPTGQILTGRIDRQPGEADLIFAQPLPFGLYWLEVHVKGQKQTLTVLIR